MDMSKIATGEQFLDAARRDGALVSDGPVAGGWAKHPFMGGSVAHFWYPVDLDPRIEAEMVASCGDRARGIHEAVTACGLTKMVTDSVPLLGAGNLPLCARCENKLMKEMSESSANVRS